MRTSSLAAAVFLGSVLGAAAMGGLDLGHHAWYISRSAGIVSFVLLTESVIFGLLLSTRTANPIIARPLSFELHQFLGILSLTLLAVHAGSLMFDGFLRFTPTEVLVPFVAPGDRIYTGMGVLAGWGAAIVTASWWARRQMGQKAWRQLHYVSFAVWAAALWHGWAAGTDTSLPMVKWLYLGSAGTVAALLVYRIAGRKSVQARRRTGAASANRSVAAGE